MGERRQVVVSMPSPVGAGDKADDDYNDNELQDEKRNEEDGNVKILIIGLLK